MPESPLPAPARPRRKRRRIFYGWIIVGVGSTFAAVESTIYNPMLSVFILPLEQEFGWSRTTIAGAAALGSIAAIFISPIAGRLIDRFGSRPFMAIGGTVIGLCVAGLGFVQHLWQFYLLLALPRMTAMGVTQLAYTVAVSNWFERRRGLALGLAIFGERLGQAFLPIAIVGIIAGVGWRQAWMILGVAGVLLTVVPSLVLMRHRPEELGLLPDGDTATARSGADTVLEEETGGWTLRRAIRTPALWLLILGTASFYTVAAALHLHMIPYWQDQGLSAVAAASVLLVYALTAAGASVVWGGIADRIGIQRAFAICLFVSGFAVVYLLQATALPSAMAFGVAYGAVLGGSFALAPAIYADYFGRASLGSIRGVATAFNWMGNATAPVVAALVFDIYGTYSPVFVSLAGIYFVGAAAVALARHPMPPSPKAR